MRCVFTIFSNTESLCLRATAREVKPSLISWRSLRVNVAPLWLDVVFLGCILFALIVDVVR